MTGQRAAQRKRDNGGDFFGRAPRYICPAISTHPHWGGDCTTTLRWQDVGAVFHKLEYDIASNIQGLRKSIQLTELKNFTIALSVFIVVDNHI